MMTLIYRLALRKKAITQICETSLAIRKKVITQKTQKCKTNVAVCKKGCNVKSLTQKYKTSLAMRKKIIAQKSEQMSLCAKKVVT